MNERTTEYKIDGEVATEPVTVKVSAPIRAQAKQDPRPLVKLTGMTTNKVHFDAFVAVCKAHGGKFWPGTKEWSVEETAIEAFRADGFRVDTYFWNGEE